MHHARQVRYRGGLSNLETNRAFWQLQLFELFDDVVEEAVFAQRRAREVYRNRIARLPVGTLVGEFGQRFTNNPPIECGHQVVTLGSRNELIRVNQLTALIAHPQQQLVVPAGIAIFLANSNDWLKIQFETIFFNSTTDARHPFHFLVPLRRVDILVEVNLVAAHILGRITRDIGGAH